MNSRVGRHGAEGKALAAALLMLIAVPVCLQFPQTNGQNQPQIYVQWQRILPDSNGITIRGSSSGIITDVATLQVALLNIGDVSGNVTVTQKTTLPILITPQSNQFTSNQHTVNFEITNSGFPIKEEHGNLLISVTSSNGTVILAQDEFFSIGPRPAQVQQHSLAATTSLLTALLVSIGAVTAAFIADLILNKRSRRILTGKGLHLTGHAKFFLGLYVLAVVFTFPFYSTIITLPRSWLVLGFISLFFVIATSILFKVTIKKVKLNYPLTSPTGEPDVYTGNEIPRPIYEDMQRYPWYFNKKQVHKKIKNKVKKSKH